MRLRLLCGPRPCRPRVHGPGLQPVDSWRVKRAQQRDGQLRVARLAHSRRSEHLEVTARKTGRRRHIVPRFRPTPRLSTNLSRFRPLSKKVREFSPAHYRRIRQIREFSPRSQGGNGRGSLAAQARRLVTRGRFRHGSHNWLGVAGANEQPLSRPVEPHAVEPIHLGVRKMLAHSH